MSLSKHKDSIGSVVRAFLMARLGGRSGFNLETRTESVKTRNKSHVGTRDTRPKTYLDTNKKTSCCVKKESKNDKSSGEAQLK